MEREEDRSSDGRTDGGGGNKLGEGREGREDIPGDDDKLNSPRRRIWYAILARFKQPLIKGN